jgi:ABC-type nitrate/sulfonate/bicarbonate transport system ATPase subunit
MLSVAIAEKSFPAVGNAVARTVFREFALDVPTGQVCAIAGSSGVGKSTLLSIVAGLDREYRGSVTGNEQPVGFMFQTPRLLPWATALHNVELVAGRQTGSARRWLGAVGLEGSENVYPQRLSLGMARRVNLARALAVKPGLLLLDEPFASLDVATADRICGLLRRESVMRRMTVLLVSHELGLAAELADRIVLLEGSPARIVRDDRIGPRIDGQLTFDAGKRRSATAKV